MHPALPSGSGHEHRSQRAHVTARPSRDDTMTGRHTQSNSRPLSYFPPPPLLTHAAAQSTALTACTAVVGYRGTPGAAAVPCSSNTYCPAGAAAVTPCPANTVAPAQSASATACVAAAGFYGSSGIVALSCPQVPCAWARTVVRACVSAVVGFSFCLLLSHSLIVISLFFFSFLSFKLSQALSLSLSLSLNLSSSLIALSLCSPSLPPLLPPTLLTLSQSSSLALRPSASLHLYLLPPLPALFSPVLTPCSLFSHPHSLLFFLPFPLPSLFAPIPPPPHLPSLPDDDNFTHFRQGRGQGRASMCGGKEGEGGGGGVEAGYLPALGLDTAID